MTFADFSQNWLCPLPIHYIAIRYPQQMVQMAFCDLLHTYHKQVTNVSPACFCHPTVCPLNQAWQNMHEKTRQRNDGRTFLFYFIQKHFRVPPWSSGIYIYNYISEIHTFSQRTANFQNFWLLLTNQANRNLLSPIVILYLCTLYVSIHF